MKRPQPLPEGLATMAPGPELAAALDSICPFSVSGNATVEVFRAQLRQRNAGDAAVHRWTVEVVLRRPGSGQSVERLQIPYEYGVDEIAAAGGMSTTAATKLLELAWSTVMRLPQLHAAMESGGLDEKAAWALAEWTAELSEEHAHAVVDALLPRAVLGAEEQLPVAQLIKEATKLAMALDPTWAEKRYKEALRRRRVIGYGNSDGTANISGQQLDAARTAAAIGRIKRLARAAKSAGGNPRPIDHIRTELFLSMLDGTYEGLSDEQILAALALTIPTEDEPEIADEPGSAGRAAHPEPAAAPEPGSAPRSPQDGVQLSIRLTTVVGLDRAPGDLPGWGPIPYRSARDLTAAMGAAQWRFVLTDDDGHYLASGLLTARPVGFERRDARNRGVVDLLVPASLLREVVENPTEGAHLIEPDLFTQWMPVLTELTASMRRPKPLPDDSDRRFPGAALRRAVQLRKPRCVGVGCGRTSRAVELDHRLDWALGGRTIDSNLDPECGRHHTVKTKGGWRVHRYQRHGFRWCTALGREYITTLPRVIGLLPAPAGPDLWWEEPEPDENPDLDSSGQPWQHSEIWFPHEPEPQPPPKPEPPPRPADYGDPTF